MENRKLGVILLVPLLLLVSVPLSAHAVAIETVEISVSCNNDSAPSELVTAQLTFLGHTVSVTCGVTDAEFETAATFPITKVGVFHFTINVAGAVQTGTGSFGPRSCYVEGQQASPSFESTASWEIITSSCGF